MATPLIAAVGNFLSFLYPPHEIVDFIYSARASELLRIGIANLADTKGLAVRKKVVEGAMDTLRSNWKRGEDPWEALFTAAEAKRDSACSEWLDSSWRSCRCRRRARSGA